MHVMKFGFPFFWLLSASSLAGLDSNSTSVIFGHGLYITVGPGPGIQSSTDGVTWTKRDSRTPSSLHAVAYGEGMFVAVGNEGTVVTSPDGIEWTRRDGVTDERLRDVLRANCQSKRRKWIRSR